MAKRYNNTFRTKVLEFIQSLPGTIILRSDIEALDNSPRQISRALKMLTEDGELIKLGLGVYAKARKSKYIDRPIINGGFTNACIEVLERFNVKWELGRVIKDYNEGRSQQVPANFEVRLKSRFRRKLTYGTRSLKIEGMIYAK